MGDTNSHELTTLMTGAAIPSWVTYNNVTRFLDLAPTLLDGGLISELYQLKVSMKDEYGYVNDVPINVTVINDLEP